MCVVVLEKSLKGPWISTSQKSGQCAWLRRWSWPWPWCLSHFSHPHWTSTTVPVRLCIHSFCTHAVTDTGWGRLAQRITFCQEQELDLENEVSPTVAQPPVTLFLPTSMTLPTPVHAENHSRVYFMIVLTTDYCWRSWTYRIAAPCKFHVDWSIDWSLLRNIVG